MVSFCAVRLELEENSREVDIEFNCNRSIEVNNLNAYIISLLGIFASSFRGPPNHLHKGSSINDVRSIFICLTHLSYLCSTEV